MRAIVQPLSSEMVVKMLSIWEFPTMGRYFASARGEAKLALAAAMVIDFLVGVSCPVQLLARQKRTGRNKKGVRICCDYWPQISNLQISVILSTAEMLAMGGGG